MRRWVWVSAVAAPLFLIGGWSLAQTRQPDSYNAVRDTISALAARGANDPWIMTAGLAGLGASYVITAAGFWTLGRVARTVLAVGGAATIAVAASPQPSPAHVPAAAIGFVALAIWPFGLGHRVGAARWVAVALLALLAWFGIALETGSLVGLSERALAGAEALTPIWALVARRSGRTDQDGQVSRNA
jgi:hypothetical membrane protein